MRPLYQATSVAANAPTAEDSTMLVTPITNRPVIEKTINSGRTPALSRRNFSRHEICCRSSSGSGGPRCGCRWQRITMYRMNIVASSSPGPTPASQSWPTGCRAIMP